MWAFQFVMFLLSMYLDKFKGKAVVPIEAATPTSAPESNTHAYVQTAHRKNFIFGSSQNSTNNEETPMEH